MRAQSPRNPRRRKSGRTNATSTAKGRPTSYTVEEIADGWECRRTRGGGALSVKMEAPQLRRGQVHATVSVYRASALLHRGRLPASEPAALLLVANRAG